MKKKIKKTIFKLNSYWVESLEKLIGKELIYCSALSMRILPFGRQYHFFPGVEIYFINSEIGKLTLSPSYELSEVKSYDNRGISVVPTPLLYPNMAIHVTDIGNNRVYFDRGGMETGFFIDKIQVIGGKGRDSKTSYEHDWDVDFGLIFLSGNNKLIFYVEQSEFTSHITAVFELEIDSLLTDSEKSVLHKFDIQREIL